MKPGFNANRKVIGDIAKNDPGIKARLRQLADQMAADAGGHVEDYVTDRAVSAVVVDAEKQAKDGVATKALGAIGGTLS